MQERSPVTWQVLAPRVRKDWPPQVQLQEMNSCCFRC